VHHVVMNVVMHDVMASHATVVSALGLHGYCLGAIRGGFRVSRGLLGARGGSLRGGGRLLSRTGGGFSARRGRSGLRGRSLSLLRGILTGASGK
jgi:hypothetical protein